MDKSIYTHVQNMQLITADLNNNYILLLLKKWVHGQVYLYSCTEYVQYKGIVKDYKENN